MSNQMQKVKNKSPAPVQITAEQLIREAWERQEAAPTAGPRYHLADTEELRDHQRVKRKEFEDKIIRNRAHIPIWIRYAKWEELQNELARARSIFERAIDYDHRSHILWLHYAEMEIRVGAINHARNVWDRAVAILPRVSQLWVRYSYMEEVIGNIPLARLVFKRWMEWHPESIAYASFIKFEIRNDNIAGARSIYELFVRAHPTTKTYLKYAKFEEKYGGSNSKARNIYERASEELPEYLRYSTLYKAFAAFEERSGEIERARAIYKFAVSTLPDKYADDIAQAYTAFEKQRGGTTHIESVLVQKRRAEYGNILEKEPRDYDTWFNLIELEECALDNNEDKIRSIYEKSIAQVPQVHVKRAWQRYIYLWIQYACWEELKNGRRDKAADIYKRALNETIPHGKFTFGKIFVLAAQVEVRRKNLAGARKIMGRALGILPHKHSLYRTYIDMELTVTNIDRARTLYRKWIERNPNNTAPYTEYAGMEEQLGEIHRARQIFEVALDNNINIQLDIPEIIWKAFIDLEIRADEISRAAHLYERMLKHYKPASSRLSVWLSYAKLVAQAHDGSSSINIKNNDNGESSSSSSSTPPCAREVFQRGYRALRDAIMESKTHSARNAALREDTATLLNAWLEWETEHIIINNNEDEIGGETHVDKVRKLLPTKQRKNNNNNTKKRGAERMEQEEEDYEMEVVFPDEIKAKKKPQLKLVQFAKNWKVRKMAAENDNNNNSDPHDGDEATDKKSNNNNDNLA